MTTLVTGTSGHLGRLIVLALLDRGAVPGDIIATARDRSAIADLAERGVQTRQADYDDPESLDKAFAGVDRAVLVSSSSVGSRVEQHRNVIQAAARQGVELLAYTSILQADSASTDLASDHQATEQILRDSDVPFTLLRNGWYLENYTAAIGGALDAGQVFGAAGDGRISASARRDYAEAAAVVLAGGDHAGTVYELAGDESFSMPEYAAALSAASGKDIGYTDLSVEAYAAALESVGLPAPYAQIIADSDAGIARGELQDDGRQLSQLIGRPTTRLSDALQAALT